MRTYGDVFDPSLTAVARERGLALIPARTAGAAHEAKGFTIATVTDQWVWKGGVHVLCSLEHDTRKDSLHHRSSGLDSTTAGLAARHNVLIGIDLRVLRTLDPVLIGRVMQNIALCRQHKARMCVLSFAKTEAELPHMPDVHGLLITLGMNSGEATRTIAALGAAYERFSTTK